VADVTTKAAVLNLAPELAGVSEERFAWAIHAAGLELSAEHYGARLELAATYLVAHILTISERSGVGPVQSISVAGVSKSFATGSSSGGDLEATPYGLGLLRLTRRNAARVVVL
jgi:hypothetical protein